MKNTSKIGKKITFLHAGNKTNGIITEEFKDVIESTFVLPYKYRAQDFEKINYLILKENIIEIYE